MSTDTDLLRRRVAELEAETADLNQAYASLRTLATTREAEIARLKRVNAALVEACMALRCALGGWDDNGLQVAEASRMAQAALALNEKEQTP